MLGIKFKKYFVKIIMLVGILVPSIFVTWRVLAWTNGSGEEVYPTMELVSVSQYGEPIDPMWSDYIYTGAEFGSNYYPVANTEDKVTLGFRVSNLEDGKSYKINGGYNNDVAIEDSDNIVYITVEPMVSMEDYSCHEVEEEWGTWTNCSGDYRSHEYYANVTLYEREHDEDGDWWNYQRNMDVILRPAAVGSSDIEILSVKQDGVDVVLDKEGRQEQSLDVPQTINEYQLMDYKKPVTIKYKLKNLHEGWNYQVYVGNSGNSFQAETNEWTGVEEVYLNALEKHTTLNISAYGYEPSSYGNGQQRIDATLYFRIADEDYVSLGDVIIDEVRQGGKKVEPTMTDEGQRVYSFSVNDIEDITVALRATDATNNMDYYISTWGYGNGDYYNNTATHFSGEELKNGATLTIPARYEGKENSPYSVNFGIKTVESDVGSSSLSVYYGAKADGYYYGGDAIKLNFYEDAEVPRPTVAYSYAIYQDDNEILPNNEGVYVISDYTKPIYLRAVVGEDGDDTEYCMSQDYTLLDSAGGAFYDNTFVGRYGTSCATIASSQAGQNTMSIYLDKKAKTTRVAFGVYNVIVTDNGNYSTYSRDKRLGKFSLDFAYADYDSEHIPNVEMTELRQGGVVVEPEESEYDNSTAYFTLNSVENYEYDVRGQNLLDGEEYTFYASSYAVEQVYNKNELENGVTITKFAGNEGSIAGRSNYAAVFGGYGSENLPYHGKIVYTRVDSALNNEKPSYDACLKYQSDDQCLKDITSRSAGPMMDDYGARVNTDNYNPNDDPLVLYIKGDNYSNETGYQVNVEIKYLDEVITNESFEATGAELNSGISKRYFDELRYARTSQLFDGTLKEGGYDVEVNIGYTTKTFQFMFNGGTNMTLDWFSSDGLTFESYNSIEGGLGARGGNVFIADGEMHILREVFGDHAYLYMGPLMGYLSGLNYHIYRNSDTENLNDLRGAELLKEGVASASEAVGLVRINKNDNADKMNYTIVLEKNGKVIWIYHERVVLEDSSPDAFGFMPTLKTDDASALNDYSYGYGSYILTKTVPVKVVSYGARFDGSKSYKVELVARSSTNKKIYENSKVVTGTQLNGEAELFEIPYNDLFQNGTYCNMNLVLRDMNDEVLNSKTIYLSYTSNDSGYNASSIGGLFAEIRELENGQGQEEPEKVEMSNSTGGVAEAQLEGGTLNVESKTACMVVGIKDGVYSLVEAEGGAEGGDGTKMRSYDVSEYDEVIVAVKGDGDLDGAVSTSDSNLINRSLISPSLDAYRVLTDSEIVLFDVDGDGEISTSDSNLINRSLISPSLEAYRAIGW